MLFSKYEAMLDLDGVFADFEKKVKQLTGFNSSEISGNKLWKAVMSCPTFFQDLELIEGSMDLYLFVKANFGSTAFLTGSPPSKAFCQQKVVWTADTFKSDDIVHVVRRADKQLFAKPHIVLIDDKLKNIEEWEAAGGIGIFHTCAKSSIEKLKSRLN